MSSRVMTYSSPFFLWKCKQTADFQFWFNFGKGNVEKLCGNLGIFLPLRIYAKSILANSRGPKNGKLCRFWGYHFDICWISEIENCKNSTKSKFRATKTVKLPLLDLKNWLRLISRKILFLEAVKFPNFHTVICSSWFHGFFALWTHSVKF